MNEESVAEVPTQQYAGVFVRYAANVLDSIIVGLALIPLALIFTVLDSKENTFDFIGGILYLVYSIGFITSKGATLGKQFFRTKVVGVSKEKVSLWKSILREVVGKFVSMLVFGLGFVWALFDSKKQAWHDKIARTVVIQVGELSRGRKIIAYLLAFALPVVAILGIIAAVLLVAINPLGQLEKARESSQQLEDRYDSRSNITPPFENIEKKEPLVD